MLDDVIDAFAAYYGSIVAANKLAQERGNGDALSLVGLRRELGRKISHAQALLDDFVRTSGVAEVAVPELQQNRETFAAERRVIASHQAKWSAPTMKADRAGYEADIRSLFGMHRHAHDWRMAVLFPALRVASAGMRRARS